MEQQLVLIVENGVMNRELISESLLEDGFEVQFASDAETALKIFNNKRPLFILVSLLMLRIDPRIFSRIIKNDDDTKHTTIVGFSDFKESKNNLLNAGFDDFISMTGSNAGLINKLKNYLNQFKK